MEEAGTGSGGHVVVVPGVVADVVANAGGMAARIASADPKAISFDLRGKGISKGKFL